MLEEIAYAIKAKISFEENDFWLNLPDQVQKGIIESEEQIRQGNFKTHEEIISKYKEKYK